MHLLVMTLFAGRGRTLVAAPLSSFLLGLLVCHGGCVCLLVHTWSHAAWGQGCCMKSFPFASLLSTVQGQQRQHRRGVWHKCRCPASPRPPESERAGKQDSQGFVCTLQIEKHYLKTRGSFVSNTQSTTHGL